MARLNKSFPYKEIDVSFNNKESGITLSGTLTLPLTGEKHTAIILISGSGPMDRDSTFLGHKPFRIIADYFARKGVATLRFDKRGVGESTGDFAIATPEDFARDVSAAIEYLQSLKEIDPKKIGLIGHSEGGLIASMAASRSEDVAFIVLMAGLLLPGRKNSSLVFTLLVNEDNTDNQNLDEDRKVFDRFFDLVSRESLTPEEREESIKIAEKTLPRINEKTKATMGFSELTPETFVSIFSMPWLKEFLNSSTESYLRKVNCPVLAIYGDKDVQVPSKENIEVINRLLIQGVNTDYTIIEIPNVNHLFQHCKTGYPSEYETSKQTMVPEVLNLISDWIFGRIK